MWRTHAQRLIATLTSAAGSRDHLQRYCQCLQHFSKLIYSLAVFNKGSYLTHPGPEARDANQLVKVVEACVDVFSQQVFLENCQLNTCPQALTASSSSWGESCSRALPMSSSKVGRKQLQAGSTLLLQGPGSALETKD